MLNVVCLKAGRLYGPEYVNRLVDMVRRNLPAGVYRFSCLTDDAEGLDTDIEIIPLPSGLPGWWGKLYLFKRGIFPAGERVMFMDLDTLIVGALDGIVKYDGPFATLQDFYQPERLGPAIMLWQAGDYAASIWDEWESAGRPINPLGDLWWINQLDQGRFAKRADRLQQLYPGDFCSFKADCHPYPPQGVKVICFHGEPRPHNCGVDWVSDVWRVGGSSVAAVLNMANTHSERVAANIRYASSLPRPWLSMGGVRFGLVRICAGGPSLNRDLWKIAQRQTGDKLIAVNGVAALLKNEGVWVDYHVVMDARQSNASFVEQSDAKEFLVSSQCDRSIFDALEGRNVTVFHMNTTEILENIPANNKPVNLISSGSTVGLAACAIAYTMGWREMHLHGFDSSFEDGHHAYPQSGNDADPVIEAIAGNRRFKTTPWMVKQAQEFQELARSLAELDCVIHVHGDGLLPHVARLMTAQQEVA